MRSARPLLLAVPSLLLACSAPPGDGVSAGPLAQSFEAAAREAGVPRDVMVAIASIEGGLAMPRTRAVDPNAAVPVAGPMELRHGKLDTLARGAALAGAAEIDLRRDADLGLRAGALVLAEVGARTGAVESDLASWQSAVEEMSGYADREHRSEYAHRVFALLARGGDLPARDGEVIRLASHALPLSLTVRIDTSLRLAGTPDYPGASQWFDTPETNKWTSGRGGVSVDRVVVHDTEGGWDASVSTLQNDPGKSVHYIVNTDGTVGQFVHETDTAWHAGNWFYNEHSVGIEHVGYMNQPYPEAQYAASAKLMDYLTGKYGVKKDRTRIVGHDQIPDGNVIPESTEPCADAPAKCESSSDWGGAANHRDPGDWEWCLYMPRFGGACKCDDIWPLWNCSADHTKAMRCDGGQIQVEVCDGPGACESQPNGTDDICHRAMHDDAGQGDAGRGDAGATADTGTERDAARGPEAGPGASSNDDPGAAASGDLAGAGESGGCTVGRAGASGGWTLLLVLGAIGVRGRRRARPWKREVRAARPIVGTAPFADPIAPSCGIIDRGDAL